MSIIGHWKSATGFDTESYTVTMGKPVADCSVEELTAHPMCGSISPFANVAYTATSDEIFNSNIRYVGGAAGFTYPITSEHSEAWAIAGKPSDDIRKQYRRTIFVACPSNVNMPAYFMSENTDSRILIVEDIKDPNKLVINYGNTTDHGEDIYRTVNFKISGVQCRHTCDRGQSTYATAPNQVDYEDPDTHTHTYYNIYPVWIYVYENEAYVVLWEYLCFFGGRYKDTDPADSNYNYIQQGNYQSFSQITPKWLAMGYNPNNGDNTTTLHDLFPNGYADPVPLPAVFNTIPLQYSTTNLAPDGAGVVYGLQMNNNVQSGTYNCRLDISLYTGNQWYRTNTMCRAGCYFVNNGELLKPIIKDGIVIGYGTPEQESEIDTYRDLNHPVPSGGGGGGGGGSDDDDMDNQGLGATGSSGGFTQFYVMSPADMLSFLTDFYTNAEPGETLSNNLVCSYILGSSVTYWGATENIKITVHNSAQGTPFETQGTYSHVTATNNNIPLGSFKIDRMTNTFYDFAPYSSYEIFIPCCGWVSLPDTVAGRTIYVSLQIDIATCGAKGVVKFDDGATCAVCSGILGSSIPLAVIESGLLRGANVQAASNTLGGALMAGAGFGSGNAGLGLNGISKVVDAFTQCTISGNTNFTNQKGSSGDITQFAMGHKCYIKITHPVVDKVVETEQFGHTVGYLCNLTGNLSTFKGFTVVANPHININATRSEKEEIKRLLEEGVIL